METVSLKSSNDSYYDLLNVVNGKVEYLRMISKSNAREWLGSTPLAPQDAPLLAQLLEWSVVQLTQLYPLLVSTRNFTSS